MPSLRRLSVAFVVALVASSSLLHTSNAATVRAMMQSKSPSLLEAQVEAAVETAQSEAAAAAVASESAVEAGAETALVNSYTPVADGFINGCDALGLRHLGVNGGNFNAFVANCQAACDGVKACVGVTFPNAAHFNFNPICLLKQNPCPFVPAAGYWASSFKRWTYQKEAPAAATRVGPKQNGFIAWCDIGEPVISVDPLTPTWVPYCMQACANNAACTAITVSNDNLRCLLKSKGCAYIDGGGVNSYWNTYSLLPAPTSKAAAGSPARSAAPAPTPIPLPAPPSNAMFSAIKNGYTAGCDLTEVNTYPVNDVSSYANFLAACQNECLANGGSCRSITISRNGAAGARRCLLKSAVSGRNGNCPFNADLNYWSTYDIQMSPADQTSLTSFLPSPSPSSPAVFRKAVVGAYVGCDSNKILRKSNSQTMAVWMQQCTDQCATDIFCSAVVFTSDYECWSKIGASSCAFANTGVFTNFYTMNKDTITMNFGTIDVSNNPAYNGHFVPMEYSTRCRNTALIPQLLATPGAPSTIATYNAFIAACQNFCLQQQGNCVGISIMAVYDTKCIWISSGGTDWTTHNGQGSCLFSQSTTMLTLNRLQDFNARSGFKPAPAFNTRCSYQFGIPGAMIKAKSYGDFVSQCKSTCKRQVVQTKYLGDQNPCQAIMIPNNYAFDSSGTYANQCVLLGFSIMGDASNAIIQYNGPNRYKFPLNILVSDCVQPNWRSNILYSADGIPRFLFAMNNADF